MDKKELQAVPLGSLHSANKRRFSNNTKPTSSKIGSQTELPANYYKRHQVGDTLITNCCRPHQTPEFHIRGQ